MPDHRTRIIPLLGGKERLWHIPALWTSVGLPQYGDSSAGFPSKNAPMSQFPRNASLQKGLNDKRRPLLLCGICGKPVPMTNGDGKAIHEGFYTPQNQFEKAGQDGHEKSTRQRTSLLRKSLVNKTQRRRPNSVRTQSGIGGTEPKPNESIFAGTKSVREMTVTMLKTGSTRNRLFVVRRSTRHREPTAVCRRLQQWVTSFERYGLTKFSKFSVTWKLRLSLEIS